MPIALPPSDFFKIGRGIGPISDETLNIMDQTSAELQPKAGDAKLTEPAERVTEFFKMAINEVAKDSSAYAEKASPEIKSAINSMLQKRVTQITSAFNEREQRVPNRPEFRNMLNVLHTFRNRMEYSQKMTLSGFPPSKTEKIWDYKGWNEELQVVATHMPSWFPPADFFKIGEGAGPISDETLNIMDQMSAELQPKADDAKLTKPAKRVTEFFKKAINQVVEDSHKYTRRLSPEMKSTINSMLQKRVAQITFAFNEREQRVPSRQEFRNMLGALYAFQNKMEHSQKMVAAGALPSRIDRTWDYPLWGDKLRVVAGAAHDIFSSSEGKWSPDMDIQISAHDRAVLWQVGGNAKMKRIRMKKPPRG